MERRIESLREGSNAFVVVSEDKGGQQPTKEVLIRT